MVLNDKAALSILAERDETSGCTMAALDLVRDLPDVPVLSETLLLMELKIRERAVDLREISHLILTDLGATIQIMRIAASEDYSPDCRITRIEDCISGLGLETCLEAMSRLPLRHNSRRAEIVEAWLHARITAENSRFLAEEDYPNLNPDDAYLVGLLHAIGALPSVLGWQRPRGLPTDPILAGLKMAEAWSLPHSVAEYFLAIRAQRAANRWTHIVSLAHQQASRSLLKCPARSRFAATAVAEAIQLVSKPNKFVEDVPEPQIAFG
jgi:HDOD domain